MTIGFITIYNWHQLATWYINHSIYMHVHVLTCINHSIYRHLQLVLNVNLQNLTWHLLKSGWFNVRQDLAAPLPAASARPARWRWQRRTMDISMKIRWFIWFTDGLYTIYLWFIWDYYGFLYGLLWFYKDDHGRMMGEYTGILLDIWYTQPGNDLQFAIELGHLKWIFPVKMVIFHNYVKIPEGIYETYT